MMALREVTPKARPGIGKVGTFLCQEDADHTARCIAAIRARKRREARAELIDIRTGAPR